MPGAWVRALTLAPALLLAACAVTPPSETGKTVPIAKRVPDHVKTTQAPDTDPAHYQVLAGTHFSYRCHVPYVLSTQQAAIEVCEIDPVKLQILHWPETEVIQIVSGRVSITEADGSTRHYAAGDLFVLPQGFKGIWEQAEPLSKVVVRHPLFWKD
ncbi:cupin domain-containing protein [Eleftheria terrae]|uniref:cupin domain-containing protein n=1 Tax=Eleftheria terrae TaxID=1597781 RepID=UPI00263BB7D3|nr:cupin domain-containing protein [Eleftheria terrae]WKB50623.1 cupin domain-containing protein [Eleftheria terrae]